MNLPKKRMPAEWEAQSCVQIAWPHIDTDWQPYLEDANACYRNLAREIAKREKLIIITPDVEGTAGQLKLEEELNFDNTRLIECPTNDTWARDNACITLIDNDKHIACDFCFNGWGMKFAANYDNQINARIFDQTNEMIFNNTNKRSFSSRKGIVLEGGSVESDGKGTILTTTSCLLAPNRNYFANKEEAEAMLEENLFAKRVLWLDHGYLAGDDTDGHIDTLARLCPDDTIVYVQCQNPEDEHFNELSAMEEELKALRTADGKPYRLLPLPMVNKILDSDIDPDSGCDDRLPATYANFLIMNSAVLMPTYSQPSNDKQAKEVLAQAFPDREIIGVDCRVLIRQHGSLHCVTMQYPKL